MNKLKVVLVDDESDSLEVLKFMLKKSDVDVEVVASCNNAEDAIEMIQIHHPDLLFLDIEMPGNDGFTVLRAFDNPSFKVIIVTGYERYALRAIKFAAVDYLLKPIELEELNNAMEKVLNTFKDDDPRLQHLTELLRTDSEINKIIIPNSKGFRTIPLSEIVSIESMPGGYSHFRLCDNLTTVVTKPMSYFEDILPKPRFCRVHRSTLINLDYVRSYNSKAGIVSLENNREVEVSVRKRAEFHNAYKDFMVG